MSENLRKRLCQVAIALNFVMVLIYQYLTPNMSDDIIYGDKVAEANSFFDLFVQEYNHYMEHIGRSIAHILLRIFLFIGNKLVFDVVAALVFVLISILIYINVDHRKKYDIRLYLAISVLMWLFDPTISNSVFWETGACNYMFTGCIVMAFITCFRLTVSNREVKGLSFSIGMFFFGLAAGWCNENTSGAVILFILIEIFVSWSKKKSFSTVPLWMVSSLIGCIAGFMIMILSPGNFSRAAAAEEAHSGLLALMARFLKITLNIKEGYLVLILVFVVLVIAACYKSENVTAFLEKASGMMLFGFMFFATCYALIMVPESQLRTYYGAGLFLMTAICCGFAWFVNEGFSEDLVQVIATSMVAVFCILLLFTYVEEGANLARIKREFTERDAYLTEIAKGEEKVVEAPMLRPEWKSRYTFAYESDLTEDKFNWLNLSYSEHYKLWYIIGVDRENWTAY